ncbi:sigma-54 interaction domain-containing protein [Fictibacillus aquaticus]|uniref:HTH-type transcriptional regulatory protein TyrR n=1 Tax=Fictibacillus aquaticus TaxID=2021314 RepID=A0A235F7R2_9BACL|nr:sigma 54-interacting transcriptional regulator [Fictibacillus aquaticus]OYD57239.1 hypothetical protein CGZ90_11155 [Fictibacillus aquaticus]
MLSLTDTVQDAILLFSSMGKDVLEIHDQNGEAAGEFSLSDLHKAIQQGKLNESLKDFLRDQSSSESIHKNLSVNENEYSKLLGNHVFSEIINSLYDGVYITDHNGITVQVNHAYERITGIKAGEVIGRHMDELVKAGFISRSVSVEVLKEKRPITRMQTIKDKRKIIVSGTPIFGNNRNILYVINSVRDITELLHLKHEIEELQDLKKLRQNARQMHVNTYDSILNSTIISDETREVYELAERVAQTDVKVLLQGETGVGKTLVAKFIHHKSKRKDEAFLELNCGALPANLIEAELFGYEAGAFTGASSKGKKGLLELAHQGTLFLDEIGDLPLELQVKLLKVVEENKYMPVGSTEVKSVDVRIIAASHKDLAEMVQNGLFREDLYYRLSVVPITLPPLRSRRKEIIPFVQYYLNAFNKKYQFTKEFSIEALDVLTEYTWPGNIRELINLVERLVVTTNTDQIDAKDLPEGVKTRRSEKNEESTSLKDAVEHVERQLITKALKKYKTTRKAAEALDVSQSTIVQKMKRWDKVD